MNKTALAKALSISRKTLYQYINRGMPIDSIENAKTWKKQNLDVTQTKEWRIDGNKGIKHKIAQVEHPAKSIIFDSNFERKITSSVLTRVIPELWFEQAGWLGAVLKDNGVIVTAEQILKVQSCLFLIYMENVVEYLHEKEDLAFHIGPVLKAMPGSVIYPSLIERLNNILSE